MAKKNKVILMGYVQDILNKDNTMFTLRIRKNPKRNVFPIIELGEDISSYNKYINKGLLLVIEGKITTEQKVEEYDCPNPACNEKIINKYIFTKITANKIKFIKPVDKRLDTYINQVILLGVMCREKDFRYVEGTKSPLGNTKYQIAVNRRKPNETDYPWITSFARQAEEDARRLQVGSQVMVDGIINTRKNHKECECEVCGSKIEITESLAEVVANSVEYLNNCMFDD